MDIAIQKAFEGIETHNGEVGVVVVDRHGDLAFAGYNEMNTTWDVTGHAEITALRHVSQALETFDLGGHTLYTTLQPCAMCVAACIWANIDRVVYGATRAMVPPDYFDLVDLDPEEMVHRSRRPRLTLTGAVLADRCSRLYWDPRRTRL